MSALCPYPTEPVWIELSELVVQDDAKAMTTTAAPAASSFRNWDILSTPIPISDDIGTSLQARVIARQIGWSEAPGTAWAIKISSFTQPADVCSRVLPTGCRSRD